MSLDPATRRDPSSSPGISSEGSNHESRQQLASPRTANAPLDDQGNHPIGSRQSEHPILPSSQYLLPPNPGSLSSGSSPKTLSNTSTPVAISRTNSTKERTGLLSRRGSSRRRDLKESSTEDGSSVGNAGLRPERSGAVHLGPAEVIETPQLRLERDPGTGRKMINQYLVLHEIGHGTHGSVRLGRDMSIDLPSGSDVDGVFGSPECVYYAIKIVDRNPKRKRLMGYTRQNAPTDRPLGVKLVNEIEIRKEIAIFKKVNHPNVVRMKEIIDDPDSSKMFMILEYCEKGEIEWRDRESSPALTVDETRRIFRDTLLGLEYLHHQGIIHRDIKPSNLLRSSNGTVKISDFGCSHYSEALRAASAQVGNDADRLIDDVELAKTAGSPAFFAPEMCFTGPESEAPSALRSSDNAQSTASPNVDGKLPSSQMLGRNTTHDGENDTSATPMVSVEQHTNSRRPQMERLPLTNAIDVWALGVTLYCLLTGRTPFDAPNEYLLMQIIPTEPIRLPVTIGKDAMCVAPGQPVSQEAKDCMDLLHRLLEKDPLERMTLEQAKRHPFTLHGLPDPSTWLASTDPLAQTFVTVSSDEVEAVVTKSSSFRDKFRKSIKTISHRLQLLGNAGRSRSRSIGDMDKLGAGTPRSFATASTAASESEVSTPQVPPTSRSIDSKESQHTTVPGASSQPVARRFSIRGRTSGRSSVPRTPELPQRRADPEAMLPKRSYSSSETPAFGAGPSMQRRVSAQSTLIESSSGTANPDGLINNVMSHPMHVASSSQLDQWQDHRQQGSSESLPPRQSSELDSSARHRSPVSSPGGPNESVRDRLANFLTRKDSRRSRSRAQPPNSPPVAGYISNAMRRKDTSPELQLASSPLIRIPNLSEPVLTTRRSSSNHAMLSPINDHGRPRDTQAGHGRRMQPEDIDWMETLSDEDDFAVSLHDIDVRESTFDTDSQSPVNEVIDISSSTSSVSDGVHESPTNSAIPLAASSDQHDEQHGSGVAANSTTQHEKPAAPSHQSNTPSQLLPRGRNSPPVDLTSPDDGVLAISIGPKRGRTVSIARGSSRRELVETSSQQQSTHQDP